MATDSAGRRAEGTSLLGRSAECARLDALLAAVACGESQALILRGQAGVGKSALLDYLVERAYGMQVVRATGVEVEMELPYAGLQQLCAPLLPHLDKLPSPQQNGLEVVFGLREGAAPTPFLVGLATLAIFSEASMLSPLVCVVDDAQSLDRSTAFVLAFAARRMLADQVGIVFAARETGEELKALPEMEVRGLPRDAARSLITAATPMTLDASIRDRIVEETRGNPLALLELPRGLTATELAGGFGLAATQAVPRRIEESFLHRIDGLSDEARLLMLVAAAEPVGDPLLLARAARSLGITISTVDSETDGLLEIGERVTFRHPLVRSAVYRSAALDTRRQVHAALAAATDARLDPDRRAWHRAAAAVEFDEVVADELELSAGRAQTRGGLGAGAAFLQRASALTADPVKRSGRALAAAEASLQAGAFDAALRLVASTDAESLDGFGRARVELVRGHVAFASGLGSDAPPLLLNAARSLEAFDLGLARETYLTAWGAAVFAGAAASGVLEEICRSVRALPPASATPRALDVLLDGLALLTTDGRAAATPTLQRAAEMLASIPPEDVLRWGWAATAASDAVWDDESTRAISARQVQVVREAGALAELPIHLAALGLATAWTGDLAGAASLVAEGESVAAVTGSPIAPYVLLRLRALSGAEAEASSLIASVLEQAEAGKQGLAAAWAHWADAVLHNGLCHYEEAASAATRATSNTFEPWVSVWALPELAEASARKGDLELATAAVERLEETARPCGTNFAVGIEARSRALISEDAAANDLYLDAIAHLDRTQLRPELARAHLLYGEWLRREGRRVEARERVRLAHGMFSDIGMEAFAERARRELVATGEKVRKRAVEARDDLTAQERQIAALARDGLSSREIATRLFLGRRTVDWHLGKVFSKLGISSRRELGRALEASGTADGHAAQPRVAGQDQ